MIDVGVAGRGLDGGPSGDRAVVARFDGGILLAGIDGLGHGPDAAEAAAVAAAVLEGDPDAPFETLFPRCHEALRRTRGVVLTAVRIDARGALEWVGVGNVEARVLHPGSPTAPVESPMLVGGVLGHQLHRRVRPSRVRLARGDVLALATDGIRADFSTSLSTSGAAQAIADRVLQAGAKAHDDALVLVARWLGAGG